MIDEVADRPRAAPGGWFGFQHAGVEPDVVTMAKALGNGMPIGACWAKADVAAAFEPGDHATTYGGQPLAAAAASAVLARRCRTSTPPAWRPSRASGDGRPGRPRRRRCDVRGLGLRSPPSWPRAPTPRPSPGCLDAGLVVNAVTGTGAAAGAAAHHQRHRDRRGRVRSCVEVLAPA